MPEPLVKPKIAPGRLCLGALAILILVFAAYRPILPGNFLMDDRRLVETDNPLVTGQFSPASIWFRTDFPLSTVGFFAQWRAFGEHPAGYHVVNITMQAVSALLLWGLLVALEIPGAWLAAVLFAVHPVGVNSVARIAEFKNTLSLPFFLASLWLGLPFFTSDTAHGKPWRYGLALIAFILALLAKTSTVMLPFVFLTVTLWKRGRITREEFWRIGPFFVIAFGFGLMSTWFQKHQAMTGAPLPAETFWERAAMAGRIHWFYLSKAWLPLNLNLVYPQWNAALRWTSFFPDLVLIAALAGCWLCRCSWGRAAFFGLAAYAIMLFPALGFFDSQFLTKWRVSDHLQYLPLIAPVAMLAAAITGRLPSFISQVAAGVLIVAFGLLTFQRAQVFRSEESLFNDTLAKNPLAWGIQNDLGVIRAQHHDFSAAQKLFETSLKINPRNADAESNLGQVLAAQGDLAGAESHFQAALKINPHDLQALRRFANLLMKERRAAEALAPLQSIVALTPRDEWKARLDYSNALHFSGHYREAIIQLQRAIEQQPDSVEALNNLAWLLATAPDPTARDGTAAVRYAERAAKLPAPANICVPGTLAAAYAEAGRFTDAIATAEAAIKTESENGQSQFAAMNEQFLSLYRAGKPFHEPPPQERN